MTTTLLGKTRFNIRGQWSNTTADYTIEDLVMYNNNWYRVKTTSAVPAGTLPTDTTYFDQFYQTFKYKGNHVNTVGTAYALYDVVSYEYNVTTNAGLWSGKQSRKAQRTYLCIQAHSAAGNNTTLPHSTTYWQPISDEKGDAPNSVDAGTAAAYDLTGVYGKDWQKTLWFANEGIMYDTHPQYAKGYKHSLDSRQNIFWIDGAGGVQTLGGTSAGSSGNSSIGAGPAPVQLNFHFHDWYRSTDNGGSGTLTTPDGKMPRAIQVEFGIDHGTVLFNNGEVHAWGYGGNYECGNRSTSNWWHPVRVGGSYGEVATGSAANVLRDVKITRISQSCGNGAANNDSQAAHTLALASDGSVWAWGYNGYGQCGDGTATSVQVPTKIPQSYFNNETVTAVWAFGQSYGCSFAYTTAKKLYVWGYNANGQLGIGNTSNQNRPTLVTTVDFTNVSVGEIAKLQVVSNQGNTATSILTTSGRIYTTGYNSTGILNTNNTTQQTSFGLVSSGPGSSGTAENMWMVGGATNGVLYVRETSTGKTYATGYNGTGACADGTTTNRSTVVECLVRIYGQSVNLTNIRMIVGCGGNQYASWMALRDDGRLFTIGYIGGGSGTGQNPTYVNGFEESGNAIEYNNGIYNWYPLQVNAAFAGSDQFGNALTTSIMAVAGNDSSTTYYGGFYFRNRYGRMMCVGSSNSPMTWGGLSYNWSGNTWTKPVMGDVIMNG